ncbi:ribonuclease S-2-like [Sesamum indicum]|uniref:Ribonuclease S-2-like n=1 Tax=Sesamum indicum TaxID=4182 RepID=A0A6I9UKK1_SESIN|nr:ribonuclease S-2-like [Sesamum indicum]
MKTSHHHPFYVLLFLLLCSYGSASSNSYNHLLLVYTWPNTFCLDRSVTCKKPVPQNFALHGLWPANKSGKSLVYCSKTGSISQALQKYERQLEICWSSLRRDFTNREFWQYQWNKHGTCVLPRMNVSRYLQVIIAQGRRFNLLRALLSQNIMPNGSSYPRSSVEAAILLETRGQKFYISCQNFRNGVLIKEIYICLDANGRKVIHCPYSNNPRGCGRSMKLVFPGPASRI